MWAVVLAVLLGAMSMLVGVYVGYGLAERGQTRNQSQDY